MCDRNDLQRLKAISSNSLYIAAALLLSSSGVASAQNISPSPGELNIVPDEIGVNLATLTPAFSAASISIGDGSAGRLSYVLKPALTAYADILELKTSFDFFVSDVSGSLGIPFTFGYSGSEYTYGSNASTWPAAVPDGSTLNFTPSYPNALNFSHISGNGTISSSNYVTNCAGSSGLPKYNGITEIESVKFGSKITRPNNEVINYSYLIIYNSGGCEIAHRLQSIKSNFGYGIHFDYKSNDSRSLDWRNTSAITIFNSAVDFCGDTAISCTFTQNWPKISLNQPASTSGGEIVVTENDGTVTSLWRASPNYDLVVKRNGTEVLRYGVGVVPLGAPFVNSITRSGENWTYSQSFAPWTMSRASPLGGVKALVVDTYTSNILKYTDENSRVTNFLYNSNHLLQYTVPPEGTLDGSGNPVAGYTKYDYDARGNVVQTTIVPKQGSGLANVVTSAGFDATCSNQKTCNQPNWKRDAKANQTDFTYDATHGGLLTEMRPAPSAGAARPLKVNTYAQRSAWIKNSSGTLVQSPDPVWLIASSTECQTAAGSNSPVCDASAPQKVTTYQYGASGTGEAMLVKGIAVASVGTTLRTCYSYDIFHRRISETKPNANLAVCP